MQETNQEIDIVEILIDEMRRRKDSNSGYSIRAFSRDMDTHPSDMSKILRRKKSLGKKAAARLSMKLGLTPADVQFLLSKIEPSKENQVSDSQYEQVTLEGFQVISDWYHYGLLEVLKLNDFKYNDEYLSRKLDISKEQVQKALNNLESSQMIRRNGNDIEDMTIGSSTTTNSHFTAKAFKNLQKGILAKSIEALDNTPFDERDQSSMTFAASSERLEEAKLMIKDFRRKLAKFLSEDEKKDTVYNLSVSLYPITK